MQKIETNIKKHSENQHPAFIKLKILSYLVETFYSKEQNLEDAILSKSIIYPVYSWFFLFEVFSCKFLILDCCFLFKLKDLRLIPSGDSAKKKMEL